MNTTILRREKHIEVTESSDKEAESYRPPNNTHASTYMIATAARRLFGKVKGKGTGLYRMNRCRHLLDERGSIQNHTAGNGTLVILTVATLP
mgnify:CR=1 FL=1